MKSWVLTVLLLSTTLAAQMVSGTGGGSGNATALQGVPVDNAAPANGKCLVYSSSTGQWSASSCGGGSSLPVVTPESYGAQGNGAYYFDGSITPSTNVAVGSSASPATPAVASWAANSVAVYDFLTNASWSTAPSTGTSRIDVAYVAGRYAMTVNDETLASAGSVGSAGGTTAASTAWGAATLIMTPAGTIAVVGTPQSAQQSGGNVTLSVPTGSADGDTLVGFVHTYGNNVTWPAGWTVLNNVVDGGGDHIETGYVVLSGSVPANYTWTAGGAGVTVGTIAYANVASVNAMSTLSSATANFGSGIAGDPVCTAGTGTSGVQQCGIIAGQISSTEAFINYVTQLSPSNIDFGFGTDDSAAFTTMLTSAPCATLGCRVMLAGKGYVLTDSYTLPHDVAIQIQGAGAGIANTANSFMSGNTPPDANTGSRLMFLTEGLTKAAITIGGTAHVTSTAAWDQLADLSILAGAGIGRDGGGADGVDILNWQGAALNRVIVANFTGQGVYVDGITASSYQDYIEAIGLNQVYAIYNNGAGVQIGSSKAVNNIENTSFTNGIAEKNGGPGVKLEGSVQATMVADNVIQWNNNVAPSGKAELEIDGAGMAGCTIQANYFEVDDGDTYGITPDKPGCSVINNYIAGNASPYNGHTGINTTSPRAQLTVQGGIASPPYAVPYSTTPTLDLSASAVQQFACTSAGAAISPTLSNLAAGETFTVIFVQNGTTACTWAWPAAIHGGGTVTTTLAGISTQPFVVSNNGTDAYAVGGMQSTTGGTP